MFQRESSTAPTGKGKAVRKGLFAAAAATSALVLAAPHASAADTIIVHSRGFEGTAYWYPSGDRLLVCDHRADGWSVVAIPSFNGAYKWHTAGADRCTERSWGDLPEGMEFTITVCLGKYSDNLIWWETCGDPRSVWA
jgi:hypothetical protein